MTRFRTIALVFVVLMSAFAGPAVAAPEDAYDDGFSPATLEGAGFASVSYGDDVASYNGNPSFFVTVSDGKLSSLDTWADAEDRDLIAVDNASNRALVAAPAEDIGVRTIDRLLGNGLAANSYVEHVAVNQRVGYTEPVALVGNASHEAPTGARFAALASSSATMDGFSADGQAWREDANAATIGDVRDDVGVDNVSEDGTGVTIAILDTGLNADASSDSLYQNRTTDAKNTITNETGIENVSDGNGHGSWVTGAIAADPNTSTSDETYEGVAPNATVIPVKVLNDDGSGSTQDIVEGIQHANESGADIISMSLGSATYNPTIAAELREFLENGGTAVYVAAGNSKMNPATRYISSPADTEGVIAVGATNASPASTAAPAYFSEVGPDSGARDLSNGVTNGEGPDVAAPGMNISVAVKDTSNVRFNESLSGTSMATPIAVGIGALMLDANGGLEGDHEEFRTQALDTAEPVPAAGTTEAGNGMVDAENAVSLTAPETSQESARDDQAVSRDAANEAYSGSTGVRILLNVRGE